MKLKDMDIVYVVKDSAYNEELQYSLRSVEKNFPHNRVWFFGGKPIGVHPDKQVLVNQIWRTKWDNVRNMMRMIADNEEVTDDFVLFNDDFFVMKPIKTLPPYKWKTMESICKWVEEQNNSRQSGYTKNLRAVARELEEFQFPTDNYVLHLPMVFNKKKLLHALDVFPSTKSPRSVYGNMYLTKRAKTHKDVKIFRASTEPPKDSDFLSTEDYAFKNGKAGEYIKRCFPDKSRFEK